MATDFLIVWALIVFLAAGTTKGIVGGGLPVMSIGLLTMVTSLPEAIAIAIIPAFVTNIWQASTGGYFFQLIRRLWPYLLASIIAVLIGTKILIAVNAAALTILLGIVISVYSFLGAIGKEFEIAARWEILLGPVFGFFTGLIGGMTGSPAYPGLYFLNGLGFTRNQLVQAMGVCFSVVTLSVALSMNTNNLISQKQFMLSLFSIIPAMTGMVIGTNIRHKMSEQLFRKIFYVAMLLLGNYLIIRSIYRLL